MSTFKDIMIGESLKFVDLPELNRKFKAVFGHSAVDCAGGIDKVSFNGMELRFSRSELEEVFDLDGDSIIQFMEANGWKDCSTDDNEMLFRQSREPVDNIKPYYELELANDPEKAELYRKLLGELDFGKFYHISSASPEIVMRTGLRCKNNSKVKFDRRIYMLSGKMALKTLIIDGTITADTTTAQAQVALNRRMDDVTEKMLFDLHMVWSQDHGTDMPEKMYIYEIDLPSGYPVYKDPEYDDEDELSACACFTDQNIPPKYIRVR